MSRNYLINLISPTPRPAFKIEENVAKLSKRQLKYFIYYNDGYCSSITKDEVHRVLDKYTE